MDKTALRNQMLQLRSQMKPKFMENSAKRMGGQIAALPAFKNAELVMLYHSFRNEAGTLPLIQYCLNINKKVVLPLVVKRPVGTPAAPSDALNGCTPATDGKATSVEGIAKGGEATAATAAPTMELRAYHIPSLEALKPGAMGIMEPDPLLCEPVNPTDIDLIVVPGVAFDTTGGRIGYGKGCYDRFLPQLLDDVPVIGLAYDFQVLPRVPQEATDIRMDLIVTEKGILKMPGSKIQLS